MKPFYKSKKFWTAVVSTCASVAALASGRPELEALIIAAAGGVLTLAFALADFGKEAAALESPEE